MDNANLQPKTKKRKRATERKGLQTTETKRKKLEDASLLFDKTFKLPVGIPSNRIRKDDVSIKCNVTQDNRRNEDETIIPVDMECYFVGPKCNELDDLKEETRNCLKKVQELSNMANLFVKSFKYQNCCYSEPVISCRKLQQLSVSVTNLVEPSLIPGVLDRLCGTYQEPITDHFNYVLKFNLICNIDQFLSELPLSQECEDINKEYFCDIDVTQSPFHESKPQYVSSINNAMDLAIPSTSKATFENTPCTHLKSCSDNINCSKNSDFKSAEKTSVFAAHISPLGDQIFNYSDIGDSSPVLSQKVRKDPVCSTPKIGKRTLFKVENPTHSSTNFSKLALKNNKKDMSAREQIKSESSSEEHDSKLKDGLSFMFKLVPEEEELLFSGIGSDSADEESVTQNSKQSKSQQVCADEEPEIHHTDESKSQQVHSRQDTDNLFGDNEMEKPEMEPQKCISLSSDSGDSEICKKPHKKNIGCFRGSTSPSETESILNWYCSMEPVGNKATAKISHNNKETTAKQETNLTTSLKKHDTENEDTSEVSQKAASHSILSSSDTSSLDDEFVCNKQSSIKHRNTISRKKAEMEDKQTNIGNEKHKQHKIRYVDDECKVSVTSLTISEDEVLESNSEYEASFLDEIPSEDSDYMVGKYLESVRSPMKGRGQFKIPEIKQCTKLDASSDADEFNDTYARDSFCVDDIEVESLHSDKNECDIEESRHYVRKRRRKMLQKSSKRWRRIANCHDSNSDETD